MDELQHTIALNLKRIRLQKNLSLDQAASCTGVSKSMIAQIEREKSNPTISTLWKIATGLQVSFSSFLEKEQTMIEKVTSADRTITIDDHGLYRALLIFPFDPQKKFEIYATYLAAGHSHHAEPHAGEEYVLVTDGTLNLSVHGKTQSLQTGDALHFIANGPHIYENTGTVETVFYDLIYYP